MTDPAATVAGQLIWRPIDDTAKLVGWVLLRGGKPDGYHDPESKFTPPMVVAIWEPFYTSEGDADGCWSFCSYDGGTYGEWEDPTEYAVVPGSDAADAADAAAVAAAYLAPKIEAMTTASTPTVPDSVMSDYERGQRDLLNKLLTPNKGAADAVANLMDRDPALNPHGKLSFETMLWITRIASELGIEPKDHDGGAS